MKKELRNKWIAALRSGDYKQGVECLKDIRGCFCALGVLCDIDPMVKWVNRYGQIFASFEGCDDAHKLPEAYCQVVGLDEGLMLDIADLNDGGGVLRKSSFEEIADWIEQYA